MIQMRKKPTEKSTVICFADVATRKVAYVNNAGILLFGADYKDKVCSEYLFGQKEICLSCPVFSKDGLNIKPGETYEFYETDERTGHIFKCGAEITADINDTKLVCISMVPIEKTRLTQFDNAIGEEKGDISYDGLTKLQDANTFSKLKKKMMENKPQKLGIIYVDVNGLKFTNDKYGHDIGDSLIISTAENLLRVFRKEDVYRIGGDEFAVVLPGIDLCVLRKRSEDLHQVMTADKFASASIGVAYGENEDANIRKLLTQADMDMYQEKNLYYELVKKDMKNQDRLALSALEKEVITALEKKKVSINLVPRFHLPEMSIDEADAIISLDTPVHNITDAHIFMENMETIRFTSTINAYLLKDICLFQRHMLDTYGKTFPIGLNFPRSALVEDNLVKNVTAIVDSYGLPHNCIDILLVHIGDNILDTLQKVTEEFRKNGFLVSINHFGTADTNFSLLYALPVNKVKLTRNLEASLHSERGLLVLKNIVNLCKELKISPVIDQITSREEMETALKVGFTTMRGPYFAKPMPMKQAEQLFKSQKKK
jgi:diguanylate cyclase (GGDEF)-like protein